MQEISYPFEAECEIRRRNTTSKQEKVVIIGENSNFSSVPKTYCVDVVFQDFILLLDSKICKKSKQMKKL